MQKDRDRADGQNDKDRDKREDNEKKQHQQRAYTQNEPENQINALECVQCNLYECLCVHLLDSCGIECAKKKNQTEMYLLHDFGMLGFGIQIKRL